MLTRIVKLQSNRWIDSRVHFSSCIRKFYRKKETILLSDLKPVWCATDIERRIWRAFESVNRRVNFEETGKVG